MKGVMILRVRTSKRTSSSLNLPALQIRSKSSPPAAYSITIPKWVGVRTTCKFKVRNIPYLLDFTEKAPGEIFREKELPTITRNFVAKVRKSGILFPGLKFPEIEFHINHNNILHEIWVEIFRTGKISIHAKRTGTISYLFEPDYVWVPKRSVINNLSGHVFIYLQLIASD